MQPQVVVALWLLINLVLVALFDVFRGFRGNGTELVSDVLQKWFVQWPFLPFVFGLIVCHLVGIGPRR